MQANGKPINGNYAAHILECAEIAKQVGERLGLRDDAARQACFATVCIDAKGHGVFLEPIPRDTKSPVITPETAAVSSATVKGVERDAAAAAKADQQIKDVPRNPTPEQANRTNRGALMDGIQGAVKLLNAEGYIPPITPKGLNEIIKTELDVEGGLGLLTTEHMESLIKKLAAMLDTFRHNKKALEDEAPF